MDPIQSHRDLVIIQSEVIFLKKELDFLMKILRMGYAQSAHLDKNKILDAYWRSFENKTSDLNRILVRVVQGEKKIAEHYRDESAEMSESSSPAKELQEVRQEIMVLKDSFYDYLHEDGAYIMASK